MGYVLVVIFAGTCSAGAETRATTTQLKGRCFGEHCNEQTQCFSESLTEAFEATAKVSMGTEATLVSLGCRVLTAASVSTPPTLAVTDLDGNAITFASTPTCQPSTDDMVFTKTFDVDAILTAGEPLLFTVTNTPVDAGEPPYLICFHFRSRQ
jgi:hypothetical protein